MSWRVTILQSCIVIAAAYLAIHFFSTSELHSIRGSQEELAASLAMIKERIGHIEQDVTSLTAIRLHPAVSRKPANENRGKRTGLRDAEQLQHMEQKIARLEKQVTSFSQQQDRVADLPPQQPSAYNWLSSLQEEKQARVKEIYHEQLAAMEDKISLSPGGVPPDPEKMLSILNENRAQLRNKLKTFLTPEEYERFLDAQATLPLPPSQ